MNWIKANKEKPQIIKEEHFFTEDSAEEDKIHYHLSEEILIFFDNKSSIAVYIEEYDNKGYFLNSYFETDIERFKDFDNLYWSYIDLPQERSYELG